MTIEEYSDGCYDRAAEHEQEQVAYDAELTAAWMLDDEIKYQTRLAISYPQDENARRAAQWLESR